MQFVADTVPLRQVYLPTCTLIFLCLTTYSSSPQWPVGQIRFRPRSLGTHPLHTTLVIVAADAIRRRAAIRNKSCVSLSWYFSSLMKSYRFLNKLFTSRLLCHVLFLTTIFLIRYRPLLCNHMSVNNMFTCNCFLEAVKHFSKWVKKIFLFLWRNQLTRA